MQICWVLVLYLFLICFVCKEHLRDDLQKLAKHKNNCVVVDFRYCFTFHKKLTLIFF